MTRKPATDSVAAQLEALCGHWPGVTHDIKWGGVLVFSVGGKMFAVTPANGGEDGRLSFKVADERFLELTDQPGIIPAPYMARLHWVCIVEPQHVDRAKLAAFILDAYTLIRAKLTRKRQAELGSLPTLEGGRK